MVPRRPLLLYLHGFLGHPNELGFLRGNHSLYDVLEVPWANLLHDNKDGSLVDVAIAINTYLDQQEIQEAYLYGYSMGGRLAMQLVSLYPHKWKGLILESAHVGFESGVQRREEQLKWEKKFTKLTAGNVKEFLKEWYSQPLFKNSKTLMSEEALKQKESYDMDLIRKWGRQLQTANQVYFVPTLIRYKRPILYLAGEDDIKYSKLGQMIEQQVKTAKTVIIKEADHNVHVCKPDKLKKEMDRFIEEESS